LYRTAPTEPETPRESYDARYARVAGTHALVHLGLFVAYVLVRDLAAEPPPEIADRVAVALPMVLSFALTLATALASRVKLAPRRLPHTLVGPEVFGTLVAFFAVGVWIFVTLLWVIAPHTWSAAWSCHSNGRGKTSCNFASDVSGWATVVFAVGIVPCFGAGLAGIVSWLDALRAAGRAAGTLQVCIDSDVATPEPGQTLLVDVALAGAARLDAVELRLERTASYREGKHTRTEVLEAAPVLRAADVVVGKSAPVLLRGQVLVPRRPIPADLGATAVGLRYVIETTRGGARANETFEVREGTP